MTFYSTDISAEETAHKAILTPTSRHSFYRTKGKRALDLILVFSTVWFTVPVICFLALAVLVTGQSPFYIQKRVGLNGKTFRMWKLRTMLPNAEARLEAYLASNPKAREEWESKQKLMNDPRITPVGNFLRKTSLDELPQLLNVAMGTMSLVGPRPMMIDQKSHYPGTAYYRLRPGMTGLWQVSDRNDCEFIGRVRYDDIYDRVLSLGADVRVLMQTVLVVLRGTGV